jgi:sulfide:quinone oxidoreductase
MTAAGPHRVVIAGGGVAALEALLALQDLAGEYVDVTVLAPESDFTYRPLTILEAFRPGTQRTYDLRSLVEDAGGRVEPGRLVGVDADRRLALTSRAVRLQFDSLVLALGARREIAVPGATVLGGPDDVAAIRSVVAGMGLGTVRRVAVVVPPGVHWSLPAYELALLLGGVASDQDRDVGVVIVTAEPAPLAVFGAEGERAARRALEHRGVMVREAAHASRVEDGRVWIELEGGFEVDAAFALPRLTGVPIAGVSTDEHGLIPVDAHGRVIGEDDIYAAGDATAFPIKQGGLAVQQADAVAAAIARRAGVDAAPQPFEPVLRGVLVGGHGDRFLRAELSGTGTAEDSDEPPWWPASKIAGGRLAHHLALLTS